LIHPQAIEEDGNVREQSSLTANFNESADNTEKADYRKLIREYLCQPCNPRSII
jgi:hypothetical protein